MAPSKRSPSYLLCGVIVFSIITYQYWSFVDVPSLEHEPLPRLYSSHSRIQTSRSSAPWSDVVVSTTTTSPLSPSRTQTSRSSTPWSDAAMSTTTASQLSPVTKDRRNSPRLVTKVHKLTNDRYTTLCDIPRELGPISVNTSDISLDVVEKKFPMVKPGGRYSPPDCMARHRVAIIIPFRDRKKNLATFLNHMHPFLMKQKLEYGIFILEQKGTHEFNRGKLMNVGFMEVRDWQCYIFHDIDLLPLDERNIYSCPHAQHPRMLDAIAGMDKDTLRVASRGNYGGVSALTEEQFHKVNGYSNGYWGWGGEDNDLFYRLSHSGYIIKEYNLSIARYASLQHKQKSRNPRRYRLLLQTMKPYQMDGLNTLHYELVSTTRHRLYTHIAVNIDHTYHELQELFQEKDNLKLRPLKIP